VLFRSRELVLLRRQIAKERINRRTEEQRERDRAAEAERQEELRLAQLAWAAEMERVRSERLRREREALELSMRLAFDINKSRQKRLTDAMMESWRAVVARNGWSDDEAATRWHDWLTGPPGLFG